MTSLSTFDSLIHSRSLLQHPFYLRWSKGELTKDELRVYAKEYFHLVRRIPGIVERVRDRAEDRELRSRIEENVREEKEHVDLWKRFALSLGISEKTLLAYQPSKKVQESVETLEKTVEQGLEEGMSAVYALELELPQIAATKKQGLCDFYGLTSEDAHVYFDEHLKEEQHLNVWRAVPVTRHAQAKAAVEASLEAQNRVLDAVCEECGISMEC